MVPTSGPMRDLMECRLCRNESRFISAKVARFSVIKELN